MTTFSQRSKGLPFLGIGVSTEHGAANDPQSLDILELQKAHPHYAGFLEIGVEAAKGLDDVARSWLDAGHPATYHFLDVNLDDEDDFDERWLGQLETLTDAIKPAWLCGDAGLWHFGRRERGHMLLLPPILTDESARRFADGIVRLRDLLGWEVLPENPPGHLYLGDLHLLDFFGRVCEYADTGMLLDAAHLAIYQRTQGYAPETGLDGFPLDGIVELHVAGASIRSVDGLEVVEDDHTVAVLPDTWSILESVLPSASALRAIVFECERNPMRTCMSGFRMIEEVVQGTPFGRRWIAG